MAKKKAKRLKLRQIKNDPHKERWVENMNEFGRAGEANRWFRYAFRPVIKAVADRYISGRLTQVMLRVLQSDRINGKGERTVHTGELGLLEHFNFNRDTHLSDVLNIPGFEVTLNRTTGQVQLSIPAILPATYVKTPGDATCFSIVVAAAGINFNSYRNIEFDHHTTDIFFVSSVWTSPMQLTLNLQAGITMPVFIALGIQFFESQSGKLIIIDKKFNAMEIVRVFK
jgi:hypothetical protein